MSAAPATAAREPRNWRTAHAELQATIDNRRELARIAPPPTGSHEIPSWLLAVLAVLTIAAVTLFAPGAQA